MIRMGEEYVEYHNWLQIIPREILAYIFKYCEDTTIIVMTFVSIDMRTYIIKNFPSDKYSVFNLYKYGITHGYMSIVEWTFGITKCTNSDVQMLVHRYLIEHHWHLCAPLKSFQYLASRKGHLFAIKWIHDNGESDIHGICQTAATHGHLEIVKWTYDGGVDICVACNTAAIYGNLDILRWAYETSFLLEDNIRKHIAHPAAANDHVNVIQWLVNNKFVFDETTYCLAVANGCMGVIQWMSLNDPNWNKSYCLSMARLLGKEDVLGWLGSSLMPMGCHHL